MPDRDLTVECSCGQPWLAVLGIMKAHHGHLGSDRRWVRNGPSVDLGYVDDGGPMVRYTWPCVCGEVLSVTRPATYIIDCGLCDTAQRRRDVNTAHYAGPTRGACPCCGHQGTHTIRRDGEGWPKCLN